MKDSRLHEELISLGDSTLHDLLISLGDSTLHDLLVARESPRSWADGRYNGSSGLTKTDVTPGSDCRTA
jgi:hypothetical protein